MIKEQFNINVLSDDAVFCTSLATECNKFGFLLNFFNKEDSINQSKPFSNESLYVSIIDLDADNIDVINYIRKSSKLPVFGVCTKLNKSLQSKAKNKGYDLIFTKSLLISSIKRIIIHISKNEEKED